MTTTTITTTIILYNLIYLHTDCLKFTYGDIKLKSTFNLYFSASFFFTLQLLDIKQNINKNVYESHGHCAPLRLTKLLCVSSFII